MIMPIYSHHHRFSAGIGRCGGKNPINEPLKTTKILTETKKVGQKI
jgi:hypothetical protein